MYSIGEVLKEIIFSRERVVGGVFFTFFHGVLLEHHFLAIVLYHIMIVCVAVQALFSLLAKYRTRGVYFGQKCL